MLLLLFWEGENEMFILLLWKWGREWSVCVVVMCEGMSFEKKSMSKSGGVKLCWRRRKVEMMVIVRVVVVTCKKKIRWCEVNWRSKKERKKWSKIERKQKIRTHLLVLSPLPRVFFSSLLISYFTNFKNENKTSQNKIDPWPHVSCKWKVERYCSTIPSFILFFYFFIIFLIFIYD